LICSGSLKEVDEVERGDELVLTPVTFESLGCVLDEAMIPCDVLLLTASAVEPSAAGLFKIGATDADGSCKLPVGL
jgi:hypothetical protein